MNILVIEDSPDIAQLLQLVLAQTGDDVQTYTDDFDDLLVNVAWDDIEVVLCDQHLSKTVDGKDVFAWVARNYPQIRRIMLTGSASTTEELAHAERVLYKPISAEAVRKAVRGDD